MVGIRRKGEKGFKTRIRKDMELPRPSAVTFNTEVEPRNSEESNSL